jgi:hypothetical protein
MASNSLIWLPDAITHLKLTHRTLFGTTERRQLRAATRVAARRSPRSVRPGRPCPTSGTNARTADLAR